MSLLLAQDERLTRRVGVIALAIVAAAVGFFTVVYDRIEWHRHIRAQVYCHEVGGLREGAGFVVAGRSVGRVESISPVMRGTPGPLGGDPGIVVTVAIDADAAQRIRVRPWPWTTAVDPRHPPADVFIASRGVVSERYLELAPAAVGAVPLHDGAKLLGADPATLDSVLQRTLDSMVTMRFFAAQVRPEFDGLLVQLARLRVHVDDQELAPLFDEIAQASQQFRTLRDVGLGGDRGLVHVRAVIGDARATIAELRRTIEQLGARAFVLRSRMRQARDHIDADGRELIAKLDVLGGDLRTAFTKTDALLAHVTALELQLARGGGSLMKLIGDPEFPEDMKELGKVLKRQPWKLLETPGD